MHAMNWHDGWLVLWVSGAGASGSGKATWRRYMFALGVGSTTGGSSTILPSSTISSPSTPSSSSMPVLSYNNYAIAMIPFIQRHVISIIKAIGQITISNGYGTTIINNSGRHQLHSDIVKMIQKIDESLSLEQQTQPISLPDSTLVSSIQVEKTSSITPDHVCAFLTRILIYLLCYTSHTHAIEMVEG
jgi:hypothetical protein